MVRAFRVVCVVALVLYAGMCVAAEKKAEPRSVQLLMDKSGMSKQLEQIAPIIQTGIAQANQQSKSLPPETLDELAGMVAKAYDAKALREKVRKHLQANLSEEDIQAALVWLVSPLGEKITKLEEEASTPAAYAEMQKQADQLAGNAERVALLRKLDSTVKATETGVTVALNSQIAIIAVLTSGAPPEKRPSLEEIENEVTKNKGQIRSLVEQDTLRSFLYTYRGLSDAEINRYIDFAVSPSGKKYQTVTTEGFTAAITDAARAFGALMVQNGGKKAPGENRKLDI